MRLISLRLAVAIVGCWSVIGATSPSAARAIDYERDIKPVLQERCFSCHGALQQQADLRLDTGAMIRRGGDSGSALIAGDAEKSLLVERVADADAATRMPPEGEPLTAPQIELLKQWIAEGAVTPEGEQPEADPQSHWAFQPITRPAVPPDSQSGWGRNPIDAFIAQQHQTQGLTPQQPAEAALLIRRLYLDLVGLPPGADQTVAILGEDGKLLDDDRYQRLVEQLLQDPRHGERWGRHWMDIWRYSDWWGLGSQLRNSQQHIWHWRDWIIESLNADMPYDEMVRLMLAGDELAPNDMDKLRATGYLARNFFLFNRDQWMDETVEHVSKGFLGMTLNCSKCHDHKYDPLPQEDYYRLRAFFEPYHVRLDMVPGETNFDRDAIPRAFDGLLDEPTYQFIRGEETQPDKSKVITPGVPAILGSSGLIIAPIILPPEASQPERRPWVQQAYVANAQKAIADAKVALVTAQEDLKAKLSRHAEIVSKFAEMIVDKPPAEASAAPAEQRIVDDFTTLDSKRWEMLEGQWTHQPGSVLQNRNGPVRSMLRWVPELPTDFDITVRFTTLGGSKWRSVGVAFDTELDGKSTDDQHQHVYVSAVQGGSKIQAAYRKMGADHYPGEAMRSVPVELSRCYVLRIQVRDRLINASLDGVPMIAWQTPLLRRPGGFHLTTFDALAQFDEVTIEPLATDVKLRQPAVDAAGEPTTPQASEAAIGVAKAKVELAERSLELAVAEQESLLHRIEAMNDSGDDQSPRPATDDLTDEAAKMTQELTAVAIKSQRRVAVLAAKRSIAEIQVRRLQASEDKWEAIDKELKAAQEQLTKAEGMVDAKIAATDRSASLVGAKWTPTRFRSSGADDPLISFPVQSSGRRSALAKWITDRQNPLTARVAVNHIWSRHMGSPLVSTVFDFGRQGAHPTHPELLDWLASELIDSGWSMKHIHHLIVTSETYRLSSSAVGRESESQIDGDNRYWWRRNANRLESQVVRDSILSLAGQLDLTRGGPSIPTAMQSKSNRRSLYFFHSNNERNLFLTMFDDATVNECYRRQESIVPQQALAMTNSRWVLDSIVPIADEVWRVASVEQSNSPPNDDRFIRLAFLTLAGFDASDDEISASRDALRAWREQENTSDSQSRAYFIWALLNHNDFVTVR